MSRYGPYDDWNKNIEALYTYRKGHIKKCCLYSFKEVKDTKI